MAVKAFSNEALIRAHDRLHDVHKTADVAPADAEAHHLIAEELRKRGLEHAQSADRLHDVVITMSSVRVPLRSLSKMLGPNEVNAIAQMALANGTSFADVAELLTANGWMLRAEPAASSEEEDEEEDEPEVEEEYANLNPRQIMLVEAYEKVVEMHGPFTQAADGNGAHYIAAADNVFAEAGIKCSNCVFFRGGNKCEVMEGEVEPEAACKLWVIDGNLVEKGYGVHKFSTPEDGDNCAVCGQPADNWRHRASSAKATSYDPPRGAQEAAQRALGWVKEGYAGDGFTPVGQARARDLANGRSVSEDTVRRMASFFARHSVNRGTSWELQSGRPTPWRVAWDAWGGDPGRTWAENLMERMSAEKAKGVTRGDFVSWRASGGTARGKVERVLNEGTLDVPDTEFSINATPDDPALLIRIWRQGADGWVATDTRVGHKSSTVTAIESLDKALDKSLVVKQVDEQRFTLGPWYVPNALDAHDEWTDPDELQTALWDYVKKGNREIRLQHVKDTRAGEWVEAMTLPFPLDAPLINPQTGQVHKRTFPAGTVMLGVVWDDWAWEMVKSGQIRGYSIGGSSERREEDPPIIVDLDTAGGF